MGRDGEGKMGMKWLTWGGNVERWGGQGGDSMLVG
jgi:hypothetical protein